MPRYRINEPDAPNIAEFAERLKAELQRTDRTPAQPFIIEQQIGPSRSVHVIVYWDRWSELAEEHRGTAIVNAYESVDAETARHITLALGVTMAEGEALGLLPYQIQALLRPNDKGDVGKVKELMLKYGGFRVGSFVRLRLPTRQLADEVYHHLTQDYPAGQWALAEEMTSVA